MRVSSIFLAIVHASHVTATETISELKPPHRKALRKKNSEINTVTDGGYGGIHRVPLVG